ncbi:MAG TPA: hypothetical protein VM121_00440 [Acidimicrobiales bacterium]|nr:hypothetical protein [Acidimicrobiales bacterium]
MMASRREPNRLRHALSVVCLVLAALLMPIGLIAQWANSTFFESKTFSTRTVDLLESPAVRRELANKLTEQLAFAGNQQAVNFRPAFQLAIEAAINTDTFRSIFRTAVERTHEAILAGNKGASLDLSDSISIIAGTLQLPENARPGQADERTLGTSLSDVTKQMADLRVWSLEEETGGLMALGLGGSVLAAAGAIALATDRRRTVRRVGWIIVGDGLVVVGLVLAVEWYVGTLADTAELADALRGAISRGMADLRSAGLWLAAYGVIIAAAARAEGTRRLTPASATSSVAGWVDRRRASTAGTVGLSAVAIVAGLALIASPWFWLRLAVFATGLWLAYFGATELVGLVQAKVADSATEADAGAARHPRRRLAVISAVTAVLLLLATGGLLLTTRQAASTAEAAGQQLCNGDASLCDLPINLAMFPATHNSMSAALYPNWLLAEHVETISGQLNSGIRALLYDTHYGIPSSARFPGSNKPLIVTDRAAELRNPTGESANVDPTVQQRADEVAARAPRAAEAKRGVYLCHVYCELGSIPFSDGLKELKTFIESHPDDVVITDIEDATTPADTTAEIVKAGLEPHIYTLDPKKPLPTLGEMIRSGRTLLVFAEGGVGEGAPPWYHRAYDGWIQETPYTWDTPEQMNCAPNRGAPDSPLFLINHWLSADPPNPSRTSVVNKGAFLRDRLQRCLAERGQIPNIVAVDFSKRGDLIATVRQANQEMLDQVRSARRGRRSTTPGSSVAPSTPGPPAAAPTPGASVIPPVTQINTLTGGEPAVFCQRAPDAVAVIGSWALANVVSPASARGLSDVAFGPAAARAIDALYAVAPQELAARLVPAKDRAGAVVQALRDAGIDQAGIDGIVELTQNQVARSDSPDPVEVQAVVLDKVRTMLSPEATDKVAQEFVASHPELPGLFDLGEVPDQVAQAAGYGCLVSP